MLLLDICKYLQARTDVGEEITAGTLEESRTRCIGVYENRNLGAENRPRIGGLSCTKYFEKGVSIRVHWTNDTTEAEKKAQEIHRLFFGVSNVKMGKYLVSYFDAKDPQWMGRTENGICEYVVPVKIIYRTEES
nr:MAG TPA: hypothetical protein [Caudoviricetes sp.]